MIIHKIIIFLVISVLFAVSLAAQASSLVPSAATSSKQSITATIAGSSFLGGIADIETNTYAAALGLNSGNLSYPVIHSSLAAAEVEIPNDGSVVANFNSIFSTSATSFSSEPLFSRAAALSQSSVIAVVAAAPPFDPSILNLEWEFNAFSLQAEPTSAFAYIRDTINIVQSVGDTGVQVMELGFYTFLENGKQTIGFLGDSAVTQVLESWFDSNTTQAGNQVTLNISPDNLNIDFALTPQEFLVLRIDHEHTEISYEAPPVAIRQVEEKVGHLALSDDNDQVYWDASAGVLSFDSLPINTLTTQLNQQYDNDVLNGGYLEIDPLKLLTNADGRDYFLGEELRLVDKNDNIIYRASLPSIVFDDALFADQGFNMFAPILNILEVNLNASDWLQDNHLDKLNFSSLLLPELFIGFDPLNSGDGIWNQDFNAPVTTFLSFSGVPSAIPEPSVFLLYMLALVNLLLIRKVNTTAVAVSPEWIN
ncbi:MAG: hypothetical protein GQ583_11790 [Methyloprofundus sp.]|nr:hypothetical protein [Methyloprofundus sp.]